MRSRKKILLAVVILYVATWIGGYFSYSAALNRETLARYKGAKRADQKYGSLAPGDPVRWPVARAGDHGPVCGINWCVPILPGVLIASSYYYVGPLYGEDGVRIVCFYGVGCRASRLLYGSIS